MDPLFEIASRSQRQLVRPGILQFLCLQGIPDGAEPFLGTSLFITQGVQVNSAG
jgi:hypothetical protein